MQAACEEAVDAAGISPDFLTRAKSVPKLFKDLALNCATKKRMQVLDLTTFRAVVPVIHRPYYY